MVHDFNRILFTTDLSEGAKEVFDYAVSLAVKSNASIVILHVIEDESTRTKDLIVDMIGRDAYQKIQKENEDYARNILLGKQKQVPIIKEALEKLGASAIAKHSVDEELELIENVSVKMGDIVEEILNVAHEGSCDIIVMGHHQDSMWRKAFIGRTIKGVMHKSKVPVFLVPLDI